MSQLKNILLADSTEDLTVKPEPVEPPAEVIKEQESKEEAKLSNLADATESLSKTAANMSKAVDDKLKALSSKLMPSKVHSDTEDDATNEEAPEKHLPFAEASDTLSKVAENMTKAVDDKLKAFSSKFKTPADDKAEVDKVEAREEDTRSETSTEAKREGRLTVKFKEIKEKTVTGVSKITRGRSMQRGSSRRNEEGTEEQIIRTRSESRSQKAG